MSKPGFLKSWKRERKRKSFLSSGMKPWTRGYIEYKLDEIARVLRDGSFPAADLPKGYGHRLDERIVEYPWFFSKLPKGPGSLLDAGSTLNFDFILDHPSLKEKRLHICTLAPEAECFWNKGVSYLFDDLRRLPYRDDCFEWAVSISTLEHVGMDNTLLYTADSAKNEARLQDYERAVSELRRVLKPGGILFVTVPYGRAHNHGWLQIFDQAGIDEMIRAFGPSSSHAEYFLYQSDGWHRSTSTGAADATFFDIHHSNGYDPDFAASARAVCCLELKK